jgi:hypothetical protein
METKWNDKTEDVNIAESSTGAGYGLVNIQVDVSQLDQPPRAYTNVSIANGASFDQNSADGDGGGVFVDKGVNLEWTGAKSTENHAGGSGGGLYMEDGILTIGASSSSDISSKSNSGGDTVGSLSNSNSNSGESHSLSSTEGYLGKNVATKSGGGLYAKKTTVKLHSAVIEKNVANMGGGVCIDDGNLENVNEDSLSNIQKNIATMGGGMALHDVTFQSININVKQNTALKFESSIQDKGVSSTLSVTKDSAADKALVSGQWAKQKDSKQDLFSIAIETANGNDGGFGGGIYAAGLISWSLNETKIDFVVEENRANAGGGLFLNNPSENSKIEGLSVKNNRGIYDSSMGGGMFIASVKATGNGGTSSVGSISEAKPTIILSKINVEGNAPEKDLSTNDDVYQNMLKGGGIALEKCTGVKIANSEIKGNAATSGGGMYIDDSPGNEEQPGVTFEATTFLSNKARRIPSKASAEGHGGGIYATGKSTDIYSKSLEFQECTCQGNGGGVAVYHGSKFVLDDSKFEKNTALEGNGGGVFISTALGLKDGNKTIISKLTVRGSTFGEDIEDKQTNKTTEEETSDTPYIGALKGGAVYVERSQATISRTTFQKVASEEQGGALYMGGQGGSASLDIVTITMCYAEKSTGGAAYISDMFDAELKHSNVKDCQAIEAVHFQ